MNPTPAAVTAIQAHVATLAGSWAGNTDAQLATALNAPSIANPTPQATIARPFGFADVMGCLSSASVANVRGLGSATDLIDKINAGDVQGILHWVAALEAGAPLITSGEASAVQAVVTASQPDPTWQAQISWAQANLGRAVDSDDITDARPQ